MTYHVSERGGGERKRERWIYQALGRELALHEQSNDTTFMINLLLPSLGIFTYYYYHYYYCIT